MRLFGKSGLGFELSILGYQFPHLMIEEYDSNWLNIRVDVVHPGVSWNATDAAMLTEAGRPLGGSGWLWMLRPSWALAVSLEGPIP